MNEIAQAQKVFDIEMEALSRTRNIIDETFVKILHLIVDCKGRVVVTGMGKSGHIAKKMAATFSSLGTPSFCMHPGEAMHGDLGMVSKDDVVIVISYSGESNEISSILPNIKLIGAQVIGITRNASSTLAQASDIVQILPAFEEACYLQLAPTSSTTVALCYGDALAVVASELYGFQKQDFGKFHPAGALGKKLILRVCDLMASGDSVPSIKENQTLTEAITIMSQKGLGLVGVVNDENKVVGIITDGDLRRVLERKLDLYTVKVASVMTISPKTIQPNSLAVDALNFIKKSNVNNLLVVDENNFLCGVITWKLIIQAGIVN